MNHVDIILHQFLFVVYPVTRSPAQPQNVERLCHDHDLVGMVGGGSWSSPSAEVSAGDVSPQEVSIRKAVKAVARGKEEEEEEEQEEEEEEEK